MLQLKRARRCTFGRYLTNATVRTVPARMHQRAGKVLPPVFAGAEPGDELAMCVSQNLALDSFQACLSKCFAIEALGAVLSLLRLLVIPFRGRKPAATCAQVAGAVVCALLPGT